jgi:hypothetical protein
MKMKLHAEKLEVLFLENSETGSFTGMNVGTDGPIIMANDKENAFIEMSRGLVLWSALQKLEVIKKALKANKENRGDILKSSSTYPEVDDTNSIIIPV